MSPKVILITGASSGIGQSIAEYLSQKGHTVIGTSRSPKQQPDRFKLIAMDVTDQQSVQHAVDQIQKTHGRIDILINNAGLGIAGSLEETPIEEVQRVMDTNVMGVLRTCKSVLPVMRQSGSGRVINISSIGGKIGLPFRGVYSATKFALEGVTEALSMECQPFGIQVISVLPGSYSTAINQNRIISESPADSPYKSAFDKTLEIVRREVGQAGDPIEVAKTVEQAILAPKPKLRYVVGSAKHRMSVLVKKWLPGRMFENIVMKQYS